MLCLIRENILTKTFEMSCFNSRRTKYTLLLVSLFLLFGLCSIIFFTIFSYYHNNELDENLWQFITIGFIGKQFETVVFLFPFAFVVAYMLAKIPLKLDHALINEREGLKRAYKELEKSKIMNSALIENSLLGFYTIEDGVITYANEQLLSISGYSHDEMIGKEVSYFFHPKEAKKVLSSISDRLAGKLTSDIYTVPLKSKSGKKLIVKVYGSITYNEKKPIIMGSVLDITEETQLVRYKELTTQVLRKKEQELLQLKYRHEYLLNFSPTIVYAARIDDTHSFTFISSNVKELLGFESDYCLNNPDFWQKHIHPEDYKKTIDQMHYLFNNGTHVLEYRFKTAAGNYLWIEDNLRLVKDENGNILECIGSWINISRRKEAEEKITTQELFLLHQSKLATMGEMISMIAHQWRQPLNVISAAAVRLSLKNKMKKLIPEEIAKVCQTIQLQTTTMSQTIDDFTLLTKPTISKESFSIAECINKVCHLLSSKIESSLIDLELTIEPDINIVGISSEFQHILLTLINNANEAHLKIRPGNSLNSKWIKINTILKHSEEFCIVISDNAGGINQTHIDKIFDPYFTTKSSAQGTGLGLYIAKVIVENRFNGSIHANNTESGAKFTICLPISRDEENKRRA